MKPSPFATAMFGLIGITVVFFFILLVHGCEMNNNLAEQPAAPKEDYECTSLPSGPGYYFAIADHKHDCDYVVLGKAVFVWRGTNLIAYTNSP